MPLSRPRPARLAAALTALAVGAALLTAAPAPAVVVTSSASSSSSASSRPAATGRFEPADLGGLGVPSMGALRTPGPATARTADPTIAPTGDPDFIDLPKACSLPGGYPRAGACWVTPRIKNAPIIFLWGDSHGWELIPALREAVRGKRVNLVSWILGGCVPMFPVLERGVSNSCAVYGNKAISWLATKVLTERRAVHVVYAASWELYHNALTPPDAVDARYPTLVNDYIRLNARTGRAGVPRAFRALSLLDVPTDIVGQMPMVWAGAPECALGEYECDLPRGGIIKDTVANNARIEQLRAILKKSQGRKVIRPAQRLCTTEVCRGRLVGVGVYLDRLHVGQRTSVKLAPFFRSTVAAAVRQARPRARR